MAKKVLVVLAAGMATRFGSLKQLEAVNDYNEVLLDYSVYDAKRAGFEAVVFIIKREIEQAFEERIAKHLRPYIEVRYAYQEMTDLPIKVELDKERTKPLGTAHALYCARKSVKADEKIVVINADDYYGIKTYQILADYLDNTNMQVNGQAQYAMVAFELANTLSEEGTVSRGVCAISTDGYLAEINERTKIGYLTKEQAGCDENSCSVEAMLALSKGERLIGYSLDDGKTWQLLAPHTPVSMNIWAFDYSVFHLCANYLQEFLENDLVKNPLKGECYLPMAIGEANLAGKLTVKAFKGSEKWFGLTYKQDQAKVQVAIKDLIKQGIYPPQLWPSK